MIEKLEIYLNKHKLRSIFRVDPKIKKLIEKMVIEFNTLHEDTSITFEDVEDIVYSEFDIIKHLMQHGDKADVTNTTYYKSMWLEGLGSFKLNTKKLEKVREVLNKDNKNEPIN